ncbi:MAG TPA: hypothetical protein VGB55_14370 [Tepidisphaeraceae bacterium]
MHKWITIAAISLALAGCASKKTGRPPVDELTDGGRGLQGKDVIAASDQMAESLLSLPELNASDSKWLIVVDRVENMSQTQRGRLDVFVDRLGVNLNRLGRDRIQLLSRKAALRDVQSRELDGTGDRFGQGGLSAPAGGRRQPDFALNATISELPNRETSFFYVQFSLVNLRTGDIVWTNDYPVATYR